MAFATSDELAARLGTDLTDEEKSRAGELLELASAMVQREARQRIDLVENDELVRRGTHSDRVRLPERPVVEVSAVQLAGQPVDASEWHVIGDELIRRNGGWGDPSQELRITYTHGYDESSPAIQAVKAIVLECVVRAWVNPGSVMHERYGSEQVSYLQQGTPRGMLLTSSERRDVRDWFRRGAGSVTLR